jgi:1-deoxy-D-xylulose-5-phosphate reductoisomerase
MKKKIAILGSTGSIGKTLLNIIKNDKKNFEILLLTANQNHKELLNQAIRFKVKNLIITNLDSYNYLKKKKTNINIYNNFNSFDKIFKNKVDYVMSSITGIDGLLPTLNCIKFTKKIAIANKESIICGWNLIKYELFKNKTLFVPVDSEHFSLWYGFKNLDIKQTEQIILTASGGPLYNTSIKKFKKIKIAQALNHPNWKMGKKISIDSATLINKIYEVIEARNIFDIPYNKIKILIHPKSYIHALLKFDNGLIKIIAHDTTMKIPIFNTLYFNNKKKIKSNIINIKLLNNLNLKKPDPKRYPMMKLLNFLPKKNSLYETVIVSANDVLVELFLNKKILFTDIQKKLFNVLNSKEFKKYKKIQPKKITDIVNLNNYVRLKLIKNVYKSSLNAKNK